VRSPKCGIYHFARNLYRLSNSHKNFLNTLKNIGISARSDGNVGATFLLFFLMMSPNSFSCAAMLSSFIFSRWSFAFIHPNSSCRKRIVSAADCSRRKRFSRSSYNARARALHFPPCTFAFRIASESADSLGWLALRNSGSRVRGCINIQCDGQSLRRG
jgi:hypothetical protein